MLNFSEIYTNLAKEYINQYEKAADTEHFFRELAASSIAIDTFNYLYRRFLEDNKIVSKENQIIPLEDLSVRQKEKLWEAAKGYMPTGTETQVKKLCIAIHTINTIFQ